MGNLFISFLVAIGGAVGLVTLSKVFDLEVYSSRIFPLIPILYAIIYEVLEKKKTGKSKPIPPSEARAEMKAGAATLFKHITFGRIAVDVAISFLIKTGLEIGLTAVYLAASRQDFSAVYGQVNSEMVGRFLRGDHPWLDGNFGLLMLGLIAVTASLGTGLWIGTTAKGSAILEGVIAGAAITIITSLTNLVTLYRTIEDLTAKAADQMGYVTHLGFAVVITLQVLLYGLWSGIAQRSKETTKAGKSKK
ncbi:MAG: hypothetical protein M0042_04220 [Nitrospiraceae bacterium]|nr:hypothetical protein [Nitrospiraceae bacterium]